MSANLLIWIITGLATAGVILRPFHWREAIWAVAGAVALVALQLLTPMEALGGIAKGLDVYLFLIGMMLLAEVAREEGLFDWLAAHATRRARGSASRLFLLVYGVGTLVTVFLSNDATAVVLTPAVAAAVRTARVAKPLPYLFICAFIANAASFVLPISNPANLVIYGSHMPSLGVWLPRFILPSIVSIVVTFLALRWTQRDALREAIATDVPVPDLTRSGKLAAFGIILTGIALLAASAFDLQLGLPTAIAGGLTAVAVLVSERKSPWGLMKGVSWDVMPLVGGLFVLVTALDKSGVIAMISDELSTLAARSANEAAWAAGIVVAIASNLMNNLPVGLIAGDVLASDHVSGNITGAVLIGVDIGPNLSVTGSLATILWLTALRREQQYVGTWTFLKLGLIIMPPALILALAAMIIP